MLNWQMEKPPKHPFMPVSETHPGAPRWQVWRGGWKVAKKVKAKPGSDGESARYEISARLRIQIQVKTEGFAREVAVYGWKAAEEVKAKPGSAVSSGSSQISRRFPIQIQGNAKSQPRHSVSDGGNLPAFAGDGCKFSSPWRRRPKWGSE